KLSGISFVRADISGFLQPIQLLEPCFRPIRQSYTECAQGVFIALPDRSQNMRLTTKGRFAVTAMIDLAMRQHEGPVTLAGISERQRISLSYRDQLFGRRRRHALVASVRGPGGGYCLTRPLAEVSVADIVHAVDEPLDATQCGGKKNCLDDRTCMTHTLWTNLNTKMNEDLSS